MKKLKPWQIALLIIFYPIGIVYLIWRFVIKKNGKNSQPYNIFNPNNLKLENNPLNIQPNDTSELSSTPCYTKKEESTDCEKYFKESQKRIEAFCTAFDLSSVFGIQSITITDYKNWSEKAVGTPSMPEQILIRKAAEYKKCGNWELAIECLKKSNEFSPYSQFFYPKSHYEKLVDYLFLSRRFDEARAEKTKVDEMFRHTDYTFGEAHPKNESNSNTSLAVLAFQKSLENARLLNTDLVEMSEHNCICGECAKYQGRVFSISGKSKKFPKLPEKFFKYGGVHEGCGHALFPYIDGVNSPQYHQDIVAYSNRPFIDDRTEEQKNQYEAEARKREEQEHNAKEIKKDKENFYWCYEHLESLCPKSFSGYRRMKNSNTATFQKLCIAAEEKGKKLN